MRLTACRSSIKIRPSIFRKNNRIKIGPKVFVKDSKIKLYGDSSLELEEGCYLQGCTFIIRNAHVKFGRCCELMNVKVSAFDGSYLEIGGNSAVTGEWELKDAATVTAKNCGAPGRRW